MDLPTASPRLTIVAASLAILVGCSVEPPPETSREASAPVDTPPQQAQAGQLPDLAPREVVAREQTATDVSADAVRVGVALDAQGMASTPKSSYSLSDTIHASVSTRGISPDATLSVNWTFEDGRTHKEESAPVPTGDHASFRFSKADGMQPGVYNVQVDADMRPLGIKEFRVD